jgi:hypothetical protein
VYIEFELTPSLRNAVASAIEASILLWAHKYAIPSSDYSQKTIKYTHRLGFNREELFSLFSMTYTDFDFRIVNNTNPRY